MRKIEYKLLDSSAWLAYFFATSPEIKKIIESENVLYSCVISIFEVKRKLIRDGYKESLEKVLSFMKDRSIIINIDEVISQSAADISINAKLHALDALIYASAREMNAELITADPDFEKLDNVRIIQQDKTGSSR